MTSLKKLLRGFGYGLLFGLFGFTALMSVFAVLGSTFWLFDLATHFRVQWIVLALTCIALALLLWRTRVLALSIALLVHLVIPVAPYVLPKPQTLSIDVNTSFCLVTFNVLMGNKPKEYITDYLVQSNADVLFLPEVNQDWLDVLTPALTDYPYRVQDPRDDNFGVVLYSKFPISTATILYEPAAVPTISATLDVRGQPISFVGIHPRPPIGGRMTQARNAQLQDMGQRLANYPMPLIVAGDFNTSPWSSAFQNFVHDTGLIDTALGRGVQPSWPAEAPLLHSPIDHVLVSSHVVVTERFVGPAFNSDHLPVHACLALST
jgi:endonuclease/exonuclease/phosphatase (EEP) superfamily protein YafD